MADEIPETAGAATRNLLSAVGFILILLGGDILLDKTGDRFPLGLGLVVGRQGWRDFRFFAFESAALGSGVDTVIDFSTSDGDRLDFRALLGNYDPAQDAITDFISKTVSGGNTTIGIDANGGGNFTSLVVNRRPTLDADSRFKC